MYKVLHYGGIAVVIHGLVGYVLIPHGELTDTICMGVVSIGVLMFMFSLLIEDKDYF